MATASADLSTLPQKNYLNNEFGIKSWLLTQDHKRIAILYMLATSFFFVIGGTMAALIRLNLLTPGGELVSADTYNKLFSIHGLIMVFFFLVPVAPAVLGNFLIPLMIGAKDVAFPRLNLLSWYLFIGGGCLELYMIAFGGVDTGWTFTTPLSTHYLNTHVVAAAMGIFVAGFSSILTGLNFIVTIHRMRAPGMTWFRLPLFIWSYYATSIIFVPATPVVAITMVLVALERLTGIGVFDPKNGGDPLLFQHLFWFLFTSCGVCDDPARYGHRLGGGRVFLPQAGLRIYRGRIFVCEHCGVQLFCLGPSHVHHGHIKLLSVGLFHLQHDGCGSFCDQGLQLDCDDVQGLDYVCDANALFTEFYRSLRGGRNDGDISGCVGHGHPSNRDVLYRGALSLCDGGWDGKRVYGGVAFLVAEDDGQAVSGVDGKAGCGNSFYRLQSDLLPAIYSWLPGNAATLSLLPS